MSKDNLKLMNKAEEAHKAKNLKKELNFIPAPNLIFAVEINKRTSPGGIILPESAEPKTPIAEIVAVGEDIERWQVGDVIYAIPNYMNFAEIDGQECFVLHQDGIFGKVPKNEEE